MTDRDRDRGGCTTSGREAECGGLKERREYDGGEKGDEEEEEREAYETFLQ